MEVLLDAGEYSISSGEYKGQGSSTDEFELAKTNEPSEGLMFEHDENVDLEFEFEPEEGPPKGVRARTGRRSVAGIRRNCGDGGLCVGFSAALIGPGNKDSSAVCDGVSRKAIELSETELWDDSAIYCLCLGFGKKFVVSGLADIRGKRVEMPCPG
jgi:hypothetical protein